MQSDQVKMGSVTMGSVSVVCGQRVIGVEIWKYLLILVPLFQHIVNLESEFCFFFFIVVVFFTHKSPCSCMYSCVCCE